MIDLSLSFLGGLVIGVVFFGGLWLTVKHIPSFEHPLVFAATSFLLRAAIALALFYIIMGDSWQQLLAALLGFLTVRIILTGVLRPRQDMLSTSS